ncbi:hypothetical protein DA075_26470 [Methylobacterium currus]|uniref:Uncharacterized protein n=1 Tax=Methylobacterium currus TaxID=2051553 RepID=A0A2R4WR15_9HYPH|nr:hypothetical protein [Methylobacterium currus]AWB23990.1 hypothetical protein DA075_26470 [Methylobacterium currus]UHC15811.1 hypothetical protein LRS73_25535 [Methylobacterium currus]
MRFNFNVVGPASFDLWIAPDDMRRTPRLRVVMDRTREAVIEAWVHYPQLKEFGWHAHGICGFKLNGESCPGLDQAGRYDIYDADTNILLYRHRPDATYRQARVLSLDYTINQDNAARDMLFPEFAMAYFGVHDIHFDLLRCIIDIKYSDSLLLQGSLLLKRYEDVVQAGEYVKTILVVDPYVELAKRILWLRRMAEIGKDPVQSWRVDHLQGPCAFAAGLDLGSVSALRKGFDRIDLETHAWLENPLTRDLSCTFPGEAMKPGHWTLAIEALSRFHVIGHQHFWGAYTAMLADVLKLEGPAAPERRVPEPVLELAETLSRVKNTIGLVEMDINLSDKVYTIIESQWEKA